MFARIAIVNRGEAAVRLIRAVGELNAERGNPYLDLAELERALRRALTETTVVMRGGTTNKAIGQTRTHLRYSSSMRNTANQLLTEMDSVPGGNEGVVVLGATNHPWGIDTALRCPGRFNRMLSSCA